MSRKSTLKIGSCYVCPHFRMVGYTPSLYKCDLANKYIKSPYSKDSGNSFEFPDWCPLPPWNEGDEK